MILNVKSADAGIRLDIFLCNRLNLTRSAIKNLIKSEDILLNNLPAKAGALLREGDIISVSLPKIKEPLAKAKDIPLDIVYEDECLIVINKPKGMVVHPAPGHTDDTLVNALIFHCGDTLSGIGGVARPGIVHRIDKDTTGLIIACKTDLAHQYISEQLRRHTIERKYFALCYGGFKESEGTIDRPIGRKKSNRKVMTSLSPSSSREAITTYKVIESFKHGSDTLSLIECVLLTGRTHQIRVHMLSIGHPVAGDEVYGRRGDFLKGNGQYLHAGVLGFDHPLSHERMRFFSPLPPYFTKTLDKLRK